MCVAGKGANVTRRSPWKPGLPGQEFEVGPEVASLPQGHKFGRRQGTGLRLLASRSFLPGRQAGIPMTHHAAPLPRKVSHFLAIPIPCCLLCPQTHTYIQLSQGIFILWGVTFIGYLE